MIGIRQVDLAFIVKSKLEKIRFTMANYDLKYCSYVFWGNPQILRSIPDMDAEKMPLREGRTPLLLYLIAILQSFPGFDEYSNLIPNRKFWIYQQLTKSILGWSTALLILKGRYHYSYQEREKRFREIYTDEPLWCDLVGKATLFKLKPFLDITDDMYDFWYIAKEQHLKVLFGFLCEYYKKPFKNWSQIATAYKLDFANLIRLLYGFLFKKKRFKEAISITLSEMFLCAAISKKSINNNLLFLSGKEINKIVASQAVFDNWDTLRKTIIDIDPNCAIFKKANDRIFY
jgi:hypothetical protein